MSTENIKLLLIKSCKSLDPWIFLPALFDEKFKPLFRNRISFFNSFSEKLLEAKQITKGKLHLKINKPLTDFYDNPNTVEYQFFDEYHLNERLLISVIEENDTIVIDFYVF